MGTLLVLLAAFCSGYAQLSSSFHDDQSGLTFNGVTEPIHDVTFGFIFPPTNASTKEEFIGIIVAPRANKWVGIALGGQMLNSLLLVAWPNEQNSDVVASTRYTTQYSEPEIYNGPTLTSINATVNSTHWSWIYRCQNCTGWNGGELSLDGESLVGWAIGKYTLVEQMRFSYPSKDFRLSKHQMTRRVISASTMTDLQGSQNASYTDILPSTSSNPWFYRNMIFPAGSGLGQAEYAPALATHAGQLWVVWATSNGSLWFTNGTNSAWVQSSFSLNNEVASEGAALVDFEDTLHVAFPSGGNLIHLRYNDTDGTWGQRISLPYQTSQPSLAGLNGLVVCVYTSGNELETISWNSTTATWSTPTDVKESTWGVPALFTDGVNLFILFTTNNKGRGILEIEQQSDGSWARVTNPKESSAFGVSAAVFDELAFMGFQSNSGTGAVFVSTFDGSKWLPHESVPGQYSNDNPAIAVLDGVLNVVYNSHNKHNDLLWSQRLLVSNPLDQWMSQLDDSNYLSQLTIPGTHDSFSITPVPFTTTQSMRIVDQLNAGIRFFDLRCGLVANVLLMFHGAIPLTSPTGSTLSSVLNNIYNWISTNSNHTREAIVISIKREIDSISSTIQFDNAVYTLLQSQASYWRIDQSVPQLGALRSKIQLIRRYSAVFNETLKTDFRIGIDATNWPDNSANFTISIPDGKDLVVQDHYDYDTSSLQSIVTNKSAIVLAQAKSAQNDPNPSQNWYISFTSAANNVFNLPVIEPEDIALGDGGVTGVNQLFSEYVIATLTGANLPVRLGTVLMDFPESPTGGLIAALTALNFQQDIDP